MMPARVVGAKTWHALARTGLLALAMAGSAGAVVAAEPRTTDRLQTEARGIYVLWGQGKADTDRILSLPFIRGGQVVVQWADVEPVAGRYDFSAIDAGLAQFAARQQWTTLQVNGNLKPAWLFSEVPHVAEKLHDQVRDRPGTLMFWHPRFQAAHVAMLTALAAHLRESPHRAKLLGLRLNFNAIGTEQLRVPDELCAPDRWTAPAGVDRETLTRFTVTERDAYVDRVVSAYDRLFADWVTVFVRNNIDDEMRAKFAAKFASGRLALFHTSSEAEPRSNGTERQYAAFLDLCRSGQTVAYAEPWASAWGEHGGMVDPRWCSPAQWNYWTLLLNLHCGVSFIGEYFANLQFAVTGKHGRDPAVAPDTPGPQQFMAAYLWASEYVGRHNRPAESPGAWVAFRANTAVKAANPRTTPAARTLARFTGDYTWLAERVPEDGSSGVGPVGPADERYGAFARRYRSGQAAGVHLDPAFLASLSGEVLVRVVALNDTAAQMSVGDRNFPLPPSEGRWRVSAFRVGAAALPRAAHGPQVVVRAGSGDLTLHLIEVRRTTS